MTDRQVFVLDDNQAFRESLCWLLDAMGYASREFGDAGDALRVLEEEAESLRCCLLLDIRMPGLSGLDVHDRLKQKHVSIPVIYMTGHADVPLAVDAMRRGALTFLEKPLAENQLEDALEQALSDGVQRQRRSREDARAVAVARDRLQSLSERERQVLDGVLDRLSNRQIGARHGISEKTVEYHRAKLMKRMRARDAAHLLQLCADGLDA